MKEKLLDKAIKLEYNSKIPLFKGIFIIQERRLHDSGYRMMNIIGHSEYKKELKGFEYYLVSCCSDVVDFQPIFEKYMKNNYDLCDLHLDIDRHGIIHIWTNSNKWLKCWGINLSSCCFEIVEGNRNE